MPQSPDVRAVSLDLVAQLGDMALRRVETVQRTTSAWPSGDKRT